MDHIFRDIEKSEVISKIENETSQSSSESGYDSHGSDTSYILLNNSQRRQMRQIHKNSEHLDLLLEEISIFEKENKKGEIESLESLDYTNYLVNFYLPIVLKPLLSKI